MCIGEPPRQPTEAADPAARTLARIQVELAAFARAGGTLSPEQALAGIAQVLADAGYDVPAGPAGDRVVPLWSSGEDGPRRT